MRVSIVCAGLLLTGSVIVTGCKSAEPTTEPAQPMAGAAANSPVATMPALVPTTTAATLPTTVTVTPPNAVTPPVVVTPATTPAVTTPETAPTTGPTTAAAAPAIVPTHVIVKAQPYFAQVPTSPTSASAGMFPSGTKVLVFSFSGDYAKVTAEDGTTGYTATEGIEPISTKKK